MSIIRPNDIVKLTSSPQTALKAILVHGNDEGRVREIAKQLVVAHAGSHDDPFNGVRLDDGQIKEDPARLADEAQAISLMGGNRAVWVKSAGTAFNSAMKSYLATASGDALIVAESTALRKGQGLRDLFEKASNAGAIACYEDSAQDISGIISEQLGRNNLNISNDARLYLSQILGADRALSRSELEKLSLYCADKSTIELADVEAICGDASALSLDEMIDAIFEGKPARADQRLDRLVSSGTPPQSIIAATSQHLLRMQHFATETASGRSAKQVVDAARPPVFWKRKESFVRQLSAWNTDDLVTALASVRDAELQTRQYPALANIIVHRAVLSLASRASRFSRRGR